MPIWFWVIPKWFSWCWFNVGSHPIGSGGTNVILGGSIWCQFNFGSYSISSIGAFFFFFWVASNWFSCADLASGAVSNWFSWNQCYFGWPSMCLVGSNLILGGTQLLQLVPNWIWVAPNSINSVDPPTNQFSRYQLLRSGLKGVNVAHLTCNLFYFNSLAD